MRISSHSRFGHRLILALTGSFALGLCLSVWLVCLDFSLPWVRLESAETEFWTEHSSGTIFLVLAHTLQFPAFCFVCGFLKRGALLELGALFVRGFLLGYTVCILYLSYGTAGFWAALILLGFHGFLLLPLLFYTAEYAMGRCIRFRYRPTLRRLQPDDFSLGVFVLLVCLLCAILETWLTPGLLSSLTEIL